MKTYLKPEILLKRLETDILTTSEMDEVREWSWDSISI